MAFELRFDRPGLEKLRTYMGPAMAATAVDSSCGHWPEDRKTKLRSDFFEDLNAADEEYAQCEPMLVSKDAPLTSNTLLVKLVKRLAEAGEGAARCEPLQRSTLALGALRDPETVVVALSAVVDAIRELRLNERVADAGKVLDQITLDEIRHATTAAAR